MDDDDYGKRAMAAYFKFGTGILPYPTEPQILEHEKKWYVVLYNCNGFLAVYRIGNNDLLRRLKRWPKELEKMI